MKIRTIIADDEPLAREIIREFLEDYPDMEIIKECENGKQAVNAINKLTPDLVFLDVQMPVLSGFEVLENLQVGLLPQIIFSTAHDAFALKAFEVNAIDYLLKPYTRERFSLAVQKALKQTAAQANEVDRLLALLYHTQNRGRKEYPARLFVRMGSKIVPVQTDKILWIEAAGDYAHLHTSEKSYLCNLGIGELAKRLDPEIFPRVHRSAIIAISALKHLHSDGEGGYHAMLTNGMKVRVSRSYAPKMRGLII